VRIKSGFVAFLVAVASGLILWAAGSPEIALIGAPVATGLGWLLAPLLAPTSHAPILAMLWMATGCTVGGAVGVGFATTGELGSAFAIGLMGILFVGLPAFLLLSVPALVWTLVTMVVLRRAADVVA